MRIVLDTNVLVSGLLSPDRAPAEIVRLAMSGTVTLCVDARILMPRGTVPDVLKVKAPRPST